jgi:hypothetical protein
MMPTGTAETQSICPYAALLAKECSCGCERKVPRFPLGLRSTNTRGRLVSDRLAWFEVVVGFDDMFASIRKWVDDGYQLISEATRRDVRQP